MERAGEAADRAAIRARLEDWSSAYHGVELAPQTLESLMTWDVSQYARREQDRLALAYRRPRTEQGGY
jgi:hypothetical protein